MTRRWDWKGADYDVCSLMTSLFYTLSPDVMYEWPSLEGKFGVKRDLFGARPYYPQLPAPPQPQPQSFLLPYC